MAVAQTVTQICARRDRYIEAETAILDGSQSYSIGNRTVTLADLADIQKMIDRLDTRITTLNGGNQIPMQRVVPRDNV